MAEFLIHQRFFSCLYILNVILLMVTCILSSHGEATQCKVQNLHVDCRRLHLKAIPNDIPTDAISLDLSFNQLESIPAKSFSNLTNLQTLSLASNLLTKIDQGAFDNLAKLTQLVLSHNPTLLTANISFISSVLKPLVNLNNLDIEFTGLTQIPECVYSGNKLTQLNMGSNLIEKFIFPSSYQNCTNLLRVKLGGNKIMHLTNESLIHFVLGNLQSLDLRNNMISLIDRNTFGPVAHSLRSLVLSNNVGIGGKGVRNATAGLQKTNAFNHLAIANIGLNNSDLPNLLQNLAADNKLLNLDISRNTFTDIPDTMFSNFTTLNNLAITKGRLSRITSNLFNGLSQLYILSLKSNTLTDIPSKCFDSLTSLVQLDLSNNHIALFNSSALQGMSQLSSLDLSHNSLSILHYSPLDSSREELSNNLKPLIDSSTNLQYLKLDANPFNCSCESLGSFVRWISKSQGSIKVCLAGLCTCAKPDSLKGSDVRNFPVLNCSKSYTTALPVPQTIVPVIGPTHTPVTPHAAASSWSIYVLVGSCIGIIMFFVLVVFFVHRMRRNNNSTRRVSGDSPLLDDDPENISVITNRELRHSQSAASANPGFLSRFFSGSNREPRGHFNPLQNDGSDDSFEEDVMRPINSQGLFEGSSSRLTTNQGEPESLLVVAASSDQNWAKRHVVKCLTQYFKSPILPATSSYFLVRLAQPNSQSPVDIFGHNQSSATNSLIRGVILVVSRALLDEADTRQWLQKTYMDDVAKTSPREQTSIALVIRKMPSESRLSLWPEFAEKLHKLSNEQIKVSPNGDNDIDVSLVLNQLKL